MLSKKNLYIFSLILLIVSLIVTAAVFYNRKNLNKVSSPADTSSPKIVASFYPLYDFTGQIAKDKLELSSVVPSGTDAHDFEPSSQVLAQIYSSDLFIHLGNDFEGWSEDVAQEAKNRGVKVLEVSSEFELLPHLDEENHKAEKSEGSSKETDSAKKEDSHDGEKDPHIWLDPVNAQKIADLITKQLIEIDRNNQEFYLENYESYVAQLDLLDEDFKKGLQSCKQDTIVVSHDAFGYLEKQYNFQTKAIAGLEPSDEPSSSEVAEIVDLIKQNNIKYVYYEEQLSKDFTDTITKETGAEALVLSPVESLTDEQKAQNQGYITVMKQNLENLKKGLECEA